MATTTQADAAWPAAAGFEPDAQGECNFGDPRAQAQAALGATVLVPLTQLGTIRAEGSEAETFLHNQLSSDLRQLQAGHAQLSSYNSPKGRVLALLTLWRAGQAIHLELRRELLAATLKRLRMFVLRSKLTLSDASDALPALGLAGPEAASLLAAAGLPAPEGDWACAAADAALVMRRPGAIPRWSVHAPPAQLVQLWNLWCGRARGAGTAAWRLLDIRAGLPSIHPQTADQFVAQMLNLDQLGAISFSKGCYPGQEIVARLHYLGNLKRRMFAGAAGAAPAAPATSIFAVGAGEQAQGAVVDSAPDAAGGQALLAVLQLGLAADAELHLGSTQGPVLKLDRSAP